MTNLIFLRGYRCTAGCGWKGLRFSHSRFRARKKRLRGALIIVLFIVTAAATVHFVLSRVGLRSNDSHNDGIEESP